MRRKSMTAGIRPVYDRKIMAAAYPGGLVLAVVFIQRKSQAAGK